MAEYIEREKLINELQHLPEQGELSYLGIYDCVNTIPTADAQEVKHGKWEQCFEDFREQIEGDKCSACGFEHYGSSVSHYHYCPNCGARMDGE